MKPIIALGTLALVGASFSYASAAPINRLRTAAVALPAGFAPTSTQAFPLSALTSDLGAAPASTPLRITVGLTTRNGALVDQILRKQNTPGDAMYRKFLTPQQTNQLFSPSGAQVQAVASYLASKGFTKIAATPDNMFVTAAGTVGAADAAFNTAIHRATFGSRPVLANLQPATVPVALAGVVRAVLGVNTAPYHTNYRIHTSGSSCIKNPVTGSCTTNDFGPREFWRAYDTRGLTNYAGNFTADYRSGINTNIGVFAEGDLSQVVKDLRFFENVNQLPQTAYDIIQTSIPSPDTTGADEWDLDTQYTTGMAGNVKHLDIFDANSLTDADLTLSYDRWKNDAKDLAANASYGLCDTLEMANGALVEDDTIFGQAALQGQTIFASSGDTGGACFGVMNGVPAGVPGAEYPASSKYAISVGGTTLFTKPDNTYQGEITWAMGGGGISNAEPPGYWQTPVSPAAMSPVNSRAVPDIAMDADPNTGANVYVNGASLQIGGTSLSSPLAVGVWARLQSQNGNSLGFAAPVLYKEFVDLMAAAPAPPAGFFTRTVGGFNDVLVGSNSMYAATSGYDMTTGLGSIDIDLTLTNLFK